MQKRKIVIGQNIVILCMNYKKNIIKNFGIITIANLAMALKPLVFVPILTKLLGPVSYGIWAQLIAIISLSTPLATLGLPYTLVRFLAAEKNKKQIQDGVFSVLAIVLISASIISILLMVFSSGIANFISTDKKLIQILAIALALECLNSVLLNTFRAFQKMWTYSLFVIFQAFSEITLATFAVLAGYELYGAIQSLLVVRLISFLLMGMLIVKQIGFAIPRFLNTRAYLSFALPTIPANISSWFVQSSDRYLIGYFLGTAFVGYYVPAYIIGNSIMLLVLPLIIVLPSVLSKLFDENEIREVRIYLKYSLKYFLLIAVPCVFGVSVLSKQLLKLFATEEIASQSFLIVPFVAISILLYGIYVILSQVFVLAKKTKIMGMIWLGMAVLNIGLNFIFIPYMGIIGAAITTLVAYAGACGLTAMYCIPKLKIEIDWVSVVKTFLASCAMLAVIWTLNPCSFLKLVFTIASGTLSYILALVLLRFSFADLKVLATDKH